MSCITIKSTIKMERLKLALKRLFCKTDVSGYPTTHDHSQDQQFITQLQSELHWERDVVVPDLEQKLSCALTAMYDLASMLNKLEISQNEAEHVEKALQFYNKNKHYKKPVVTTSKTNDDLPF